MILLNDVQQKTKKGLARFGPDAQGAADSLQPLYVSQGGGGAMVYHHPVAYVFIRDTA